jgi:lysozyme family protein
VTVYVTGPDGQTASQTTTEVTVAQGPNPSPPPPPPPSSNPSPTPTSTPTPAQVFNLAYQFIRDAEGGLSNVKGDQGGLTKFGVTQSTYNSYRRSLGEKPQSVRLISEAEVRDIFENRLWIATGADKLPPLLGIVQLDTEVNFGTGGYNPKKHTKGASAFLQETLDAAKPGETDLELAQDYINLRIAFRYERVKFLPSQKKFLQGWLNRDNALKTYVAQLAPMFGQ